MVLQYHLLEALRLNHISSVSGEVKLMKLDVDGTGGQGRLRVYVTALVVNCNMDPLDPPCAGPQGHVTHEGASETQDMLNPF